MRWVEFPYRSEPMAPVPLQYQNTLLCLFTGPNKLESQLDPNGRGQKFHAQTQQSLSAQLRGRVTGTSMDWADWQKLILIGLRTRWCGCLCKAVVGIQKGPTGP